MSYKRIKHITSQPFFCSSLVKTKPTCLCPEELQFWSKKRYYICINIDRTTTWSIQMKIFALFLCLRASLRLSLQFPFKGTSPHRFGEENKRNSSSWVSTILKSLAKEKRKKKLKKKKKIMCINLPQNKTCHMADFVSLHYGPLLQHIHISGGEKRQGYNDIIAQYQF